MIYNGIPTGEADQFETARACLAGDAVVYTVGDAADAAQRQVPRPLLHRPGRHDAGDPGRHHQRLLRTCASQILTDVPGVAVRPQDKKEHDHHRLGG